MKRLLCGVLALMLLLTGCAFGTDPTDSVPTEFSYPQPVWSASETDPAPETLSPEPETTLPAETEDPDADTLTGVEMVLPENMVATPGTPWVNVTISFPKVTLSGPEEDRTCYLVLFLDDEIVEEWPELLLSPGQEETVELAFSFDRSQADRVAVVKAVLTCGSSRLTREAEIAVDNYPEEYYLLNDDAFPYSIDVIRSRNVVIVYGRDEDDKYTVPVRVCICSTGTATPTGYYSLGSKREWASLYGGVWGQYVCGIRGNILFHTVPYYTKDKGDLETEEYNKLGTACSMGCVRLQAGEIKWIYDNCPSGTSVHIYDAEELPEGVEAPSFEPLDPSDPRAGWDPTDPDENNPWNAEP